MTQKQIPLSKTAKHFSNNTRQFSFDAELYQSGKNKVPFMHFHDFYEFSIYLGKKPAVYRLFDQEYLVTFGDIVRCDLMDEHMWMAEDNDQCARFTVGLASSYVMSSSTKYVYAAPAVGMTLTAIRLIQKVVETVKQIRHGEDETEGV